MEGMKAGGKPRQETRASKIFCCFSILMACSPRLGDDLLHFVNLPLSTTESTELCNKVLVNQSTNFGKSSKTKAISGSIGDDNDRREFGFAGDGLRLCIIFVLRASDPVSSSFVPSVSLVSSLRILFRCFPACTPQPQQQPETTNRMSPTDNRPVEHESCQLNKKEENR